MERLLFLPLLLICLAFVPSVIGTASACDPSDRFTEKVAE